MFTELDLSQFLNSVYVSELPFLLRLGRWLYLYGLTQIRACLPWSL